MKIEEITNKSAKNIFADDNGDVKGIMVEVADSDILAAVCVASGALALITGKMASDGIKKVASHITKFKAAANSNNETDQPKTSLAERVICAVTAVVDTANAALALATCARACITGIRAAHALLKEIRE